MNLERNVRAPVRAGDATSWVMAAVLAGLWGLLAVLPGTRGVFFTQANLSTLLVQNAVLLVIAVGMTMVILIRGIDLSAGATVALVGTVVALLQLQLGLSAPFAITVGLAVGALLGGWHGFWASRGIPAFVITLAGFKAYRGGAIVLSHARGLSPMKHDLEALAGSIPTCATVIVVGVVVAGGLALTVRDAARRRALDLPVAARALWLRVGCQVALGGLVLGVFADRGMPVLVLIAGGVAIWGVFVTKRTRFGRHLFAIGGNPEAARLSGVDVTRTTIYAYMICGVLTAIAGIMLAARTNGVTPGTQGNLLELDAVTAVVIGGTALAGGRGSIIGTVLGTLVFSTLSNGMNHLHVDSNLQLIFTGLILLVAVLIAKGKRS